MSRAARTCMVSFLAIDCNVHTHHISGLDPTPISLGPLIVMAVHYFHANRNCMDGDDRFISPWSVVASVHSIETAGLVVVVVAAYGVVRSAEVAITTRIPVFVLPRRLRNVGVDLLWDFQYPAYCVCMK